MIYPYILHVILPIQKVGIIQEHIYIYMPIWSRSTILPIQLPQYFHKIMDNTIILDGYIITHIFIWVSNTHLFTCWVILISISFHPRQRGTEGLVIHPFSKHPNAPLYITIWKPLVFVPQVLNAFPKGVPNNTTLSSWVHVEPSHWLKICIYEKIFANIFGLS
jgi:hypothetical protein